MISKKRLLPGQMSHEEAISRARALVPAIQERAALAETQRRQPEETIQELVDAGLIRLLVPARWGGYEFPVSPTVNLIIEIGKADASAGWCTSFLISHAWVIMRFPEQAQREVWADDPDALIVTSFAPAGQFTPVEGGYRLSGTWSWSSAVDYGEWLVVSALPASMDGPPRTFLIPRDDYEIRDTWHVSGLAASGSQNVEVKDCFVPEHRSILMPHLAHAPSTDSTVHTGTLYRLPLIPFFTIFLAAPILGATIGAYEFWRERSRTKFTGLSNERVTEFTHQQIRFAETAVDIAASQALLNEAINRVDSGEPFTTESYNRLRLYYAAISRFCVQAVERLYATSGGATNYSVNPLQRYWRDIHAMSAHIGLNFDTAGEQFGRAEFGLPPNPRDPFASQP